MLETEDPRQALEAKDLPTQAAAARDLALMGTWDDVGRLLELATSHKRTGMRLSAAAAAADILHRFRTGAAGEPLGKERVQFVLDWTKSNDPGVNPSALMLLSAIPERAVIDRLGRLLRDPRGDVRAGAAVAVRRMALSHTDMDLAYLRSSFGSWLANRKTPPDAVVELVRLVGDLGWSDLRGAILDQRTGSTAVAEALETAIARLDARQGLAAWSGLYVSTGLDVLEQDAAERPGHWILVHDGAIADSKGRAGAAELRDGRLHSDLLPEPARLIWAPRVGEPERAPVLQVTGQSWFQVGAADLIDWLDAHGDALTEAHRPAAGAFVAALAELEGARGVRGRAMAAVVAGDLDGAHEQLTALTGKKKPRADLFLWLGRLEEARGDSAAAITAYETYLDRAAKKATHRASAEARLEALRG